MCKKYGVEMFDPLNEQFDPHTHMEVFQVQDASKQSSSVEVVLKLRYTIHDRVIHPTKVGIVEAVESEVVRNYDPSLVESRLC
jgi:molecular chaperone GrpE